MPAYAVPYTCLFHIYIDLITHTSVFHPGHYTVHLHLCLYQLSFHSASFISACPCQVHPVSWTLRLLYLYLYFCKAENLKASSKTLICVFSVAPTHVWCGKVLSACYNKLGSIQEAERWIFHLTLLIVSLELRKFIRNLDGSQEWLHEFQENEVHNAV